MQARLGVIVNPVAGLGGAFGFKGSDGADVQARARADGAVAASPLRAAEALRAVAAAGVPVLTVGGAMGAALGRELALRHAVVASYGDTTRGRDTTAAAAALVSAGAELILFAGGDGTARDVLAGAGGVPILGIPGGAKMYSGVFGATPALAGWLAARFASMTPALRQVTEAEVLDIDEASLRQDEPAIRLYGTALVPHSPTIARAKASVPADDEQEIAALCRSLAAQPEPECLTIVGPGRTMRQFMAAHGLPKTLLGIDLLRDGALVAADCGEAQILAALDERPARVVVGLLGGQGCLFGRGNQPISSRVLRHVGRERLTVLAGAGKLATLSHGLFADTGDPTLDRALAGFIRVHTGPRRTSLVRVRSADELRLAS